jgi:hypothetical protein
VGTLLAGCRRWLGLGAFALLGPALPFQAAAQAVSEPAVKAAYLYKFAGYVEWPAQAQGGPDFVIGVQGADDVAAELERILPGRTLGNRRMTVRRVRTVDDMKGVQLLFVGRTEANLREQMRAAQRQGTVTVTELDRGLEMGSVINLVTLEDRVGFEVSLESAERTGVNISSRMLNVARRVVGKG